jgi:hypothetical protein
MKNSITFFRQARRDGGIRTGVELDGDTLFSRFDEGASDDDPAIVWYVDVKFTGRTLPHDPEGIRKFLVDCEASVARLLTELAASIPAGIDTTLWPIRSAAKVGTVRVEVACSAVRRLDASRLAARLRDIAGRWRELVSGLAEVEA